MAILSRRGVFSGEQTVEQYPVLKPSYRGKQGTSNAAENKLHISNPSPPLCLLPPTQAHLCHHHIRLSHNFNSLPALQNLSEGVFLLLPDGKEKQVHRGVALSARCDESGSSKWLRQAWPGSACDRLVLVGGVEAQNVVVAVPCLRW